MLSHTKFQIGRNVFHITFPQPHSSSFTEATFISPSRFAVEKKKKKKKKIMAIAKLFALHANAKVL